MDSERIKERIRENAAEIVRLQSRIHETCTQRSKSSEKMREWKQACAEFHARYAGLAFPGGYQGDVLERISRGEPQAMEAAICFLAVKRPRQLVPSVLATRVADQLTKTGYRPRFRDYRNRRRLRRPDLRRICSSAR